MTERDEPGMSPGLSPLDVLLTLMRAKWEAGDRDGAADLARAAAPYLHSRRDARRAGARAADRSREPQHLTDAELARSLADELEPTQGAADQTGHTIEPE